MLIEVAIAVAQLPADAATPTPVPAIIVTGERQPRRLKDTAASVSVYTAEDAARLPAADRLESILALIPNLQMGSGGEAPTIRGQDSTGVIRDLPAFLGGTRPRTTLQIDGRPADYFELVFGLQSLWDIDRVEVFRSPQTITQGRNAIAGAMFVTTAEPTFEWEGLGRAIASTHGRRQLSAAASGPISGDSIAFRLSADWGRDRPASDITDRMVGADPDIDKQWLVRLKLLAESSSVLRLKSSILHSHSQAPQIESVRAPFKERRDPLATYGIFGTWIDAWTGAALYDPSSSLSMTTPLTATRSRYRRYAPLGLGEARVGKRLLTAEQLVRWKASAGLSLLAGVHLLGERTDQHIDLTTLPGTNGIGDFDDRQRSAGLFGQVEWTVTPQVTLTAAARWQRDRQDRFGSLTGPLIDATIDYKGRFGAVMPKLALAWSPDPRITIGAMTQKAYNPGGSTLLLSGKVDTFDREILWDHELFARGSAFAGRLRWSANLFVQQFRDAQRPLDEAIPVPGGPPLIVSSLANAPRARSRGAEAEVDWRATSRLRVRAGLGLLDTRITRTLVPSDPLLGREFQRAPHFSGSLSVDWRPIDRLTLSAQARRNSGYFSDDANTPLRRIGGGSIVDAKASYELGPTRISAYVRNLANRFRLTYLFPAAAFGTATDPREFGLELSRRF
jgi:outer membrane receptor protein involved in Fe transport